MTASVRRVAIALAAFRPDPGIMADQLDSIRQQTLNDWSCHVTFDSPMEEVLASELLRPFRQDSRFVWSQNPTRLGHKLNFERAIGLAAASGAAAIACCDQDDRWYPEKLSTCVAELARLPDFSLVHSDMHLLVDGEVRRQSVWELERRRVENASTGELLIRNVVTGCTMLMDAELARTYPRIPEAARFHDHWYALLASVRGVIQGIPSPLMAYRQHSGNVVGVVPFKDGLATRLLRGARTGAWTHRVRDYRTLWLRACALEKTLSQEAGAHWTRSSGFESDGFQASLRMLASCGLHLTDDRALATECFKLAVGASGFWRP